MADYLSSWQEPFDWNSSRPYFRDSDLEFIISSSLQSVHEKFNEVQASLLPVVRWFFGASLRPEVYAVGNNVINDFHELLDALSNGSGRTAARTARSIFELVVTFCEVCDNLESGIRYSRHTSVTAQLQARVKTGLSTLSGRELSIESRRLANLKRDSEKDYKNAVHDYGSTFDKGWSQANFYDLCKKYGKDPLYDVYRLLSQVTHGSHGGIMGTYREMQGSGVHRTGRSLELAILAYYHGIYFFRDFIAELSTRLKDIDTRLLLQRLDETLALWPEYRRMMTKIDAILWPTEPPPGVVALVKAYETGALRWFLYEPVLELAFPADTPSNSSHLAAEAVARARDTAGPKGPTQGSNYVVATIPGVPVPMKPNSKPIPIRALLELPEDAQLPDFP